MLKKEVREFRTEILLSITGVLLCEEFSLMHEAAEFVLGAPIFMHHFANSEMNSMLRKSLLKQHPDLPELGDDITPENWREKTKVLIDKLGGKRTVTKGSGIGRMGTTEGIPLGKKAVVLNV